MSLCSSSTTIMSLPLDLERGIFELALSDDPKLAAPLMLVAHRTRTWVEPLLFSTIRVRGKPDGHAFLRAIATQPPEYFALNVKHLVLEPDAGSAEGSMLKEDEALNILRLCSGLVSFGTTFRYNSPAVLEVLGTMRVRRMTLNLGELFRVPDPAAGDVPPRPVINPAHRAFRHTTHFSLHDALASVDDRRALFAVLPRLPAATHIRFQVTTPFSSLIRELLPLAEQMQQLKLLLVTRDTNEFPEPAHRIADIEEFEMDVRVVCAWRKPSYVAFWADWEVGARGGRDAWIDAEEYVQRKRDGEVHGEFGFYLHSRVTLSGVNFQRTRFGRCRLWLDTTLTAMARQRNSKRF
ncbi:hypothetical protein MKEN_01316000 [Mycena kentingensis (nom. inval.)]|nr:hypothetical protein MKEN_01316000 [Mycena kentingensis (nom. inval.)]